LDIRLFIKYDIDEQLPWHSTVSRTRQLYGEEVFLELFRRILSLCVEKGMVSGRRQAVDIALIKANASIDSLVEKEVLEDVVDYATELNQNSEYKVTAQKKKRVEQHHDWKKCLQKLPFTQRMLRRKNEIQKAIPQHPQRILRPYAQETD